MPNDDLTPTAQEQASTAELVRDALDDARRLIQLEVELAKDDLKRQAMAARAGAIALGISAVLLTLGLALLLVALALFIFPGPIPALVVGLLLVAAAGLGATTGRKLLPKKPLRDTRRRLETDIGSLKDQIFRERTA
jgi:uncharacterized membrane protein YqjE